jgi:Protein of unknown function (DUF3303)
MRPFPASRRRAANRREGSNFSAGTCADLSGGFDLVECNDVKALAAFALMWSDLMEITAVPVIEDKALGEVLS